MLMDLLNLWTQEILIHQQFFVTYGLLQSRNRLQRHLLFSAKIQALSKEKSMETAVKMMIPKK